ncbi:MAG: hypothetical protein BWY94_00150 [Actinobacteria bacterium ADurb.BinA094]|nr:MAG: hypothetical protein BWY94_00150 [Actinobacteria bacterium ADurb.BinA094]
MDQEPFKIELFVFPDGTSVEMMVFDRPRRAAASRPVAPSCCAPPPPPLEPRQDQACPVCGSGLVYPEDWERSGTARWTLHLRCPECETRRVVTVGRAAVERINRSLHEAARTLARETERLTRRNFEEEAERIADALRRDLILPMDF